MLRFGSNPPVAVIEYEGKTYYHITKDTTQPGASKDDSTLARKQRQVAVIEARKLLENSEKVHTECSQESEVLDALHNAAYKLTLSVRKARFSGNTNTMRNYKRKRSQIKKLHAALANRVIRDTSDDQELRGSEHSGPVDTPYSLSVKAKHPHELKRLIRKAIMNEFWTRTMKRPTHFPGCGPSMTTGRNFPGCAINFRLQICFVEFVFLLDL